MANGNITAKEMIAYARTFLGIKENPKGSNKVIFNTAYYGKEVSGSAYPWCAVFIWYLFNTKGMKHLYCDGNKCAYTPTLYNFYNKKGMTYATPKVGDLVFYNWGSGRIKHVGIVSEVVNNKTFKAIEGNTSVGNDSNGGEVMERTRNIGVNVVGFARPDYGDTNQTNSKYNAPTKPVGKLMTVTASDSLNIRKSDNSTAPIIGVLKTGSQVTVVKTSNDFAFINGWVSDSYLKNGLVIANSLNIRETAAGKIIGLLKKNSKLTIIKTTTSWAYFEGWVSLKYLK